MDTHSKINKWLLSIIGAGLIIFCLVGAGLALSELFGRRGGRSGNQNGIIVSTEQAQKLVADSIRKQVISLKQMVLLDSAKQEFLIPVGQAQLEKDEHNLDLKSGSYESNKSFRYNKYRNDDGSNLNNLLFYDGKNGQMKPLFSERLSISRFDIIWKGIGKPVLIFFTDADSNKDKVLNNDDLEKLAIWMTGWEKVKVLNIPEKTPLDVKYDVKNFLVLAFGQDRDKDGTFENGQEPVHFYRLNLTCPDPQCVDFHQVVDDETLKILQRKLDGL